MDIWEKWVDHYRKLGIDSNKICKDGIFNEKQYEESSKKILYVMKEVNDWPGGDLRTLFNDGLRIRMWFTIARWTSGILNGFPEYKDIDKNEIYTKDIHKIACINLKKTSGGSISNMAVINAHAYIGRHLLSEQITEIDPDIIIACGTFESLIWLLNLGVNPDNPHEKISKCGKYLVVPFRHPARVNNKKTYEQLRKLLSEYISVKA
ncbi:MAG: hypothetical protein V3V99_11755 [candidate division Zixibacteria bacterium]